MSSEEDRAKKHREASEREAAKLWRAWRTVHEMVQDRGYELSEEEVKISFDDFKRKYTADDGSVLYVFFSYFFYVLALTSRPDVKI